MNAPDLDTLWKSPQNQPSPDAMESLKQQLHRRLRGRYRSFLLITGNAAIWLIVVLVRLGHSLMSGGYLDLKREWGALLLLALTLVVLTLFWKQQIRHRRRHAAASLSIRASLEALVSENRLSRTRLKIVAVLQGAMLAVLPLVVFQLRAAGKAGGEIVVPFLVIFPLIIGAVLLGMFYHDRRHLRPRQKELEAMLQGYA